jgi:acetate kinase
MSGSFLDFNDKKIEKNIANHQVALDMVIKNHLSVEFGDLKSIKAIGHRVVHG